jgi:hypothetical protein
VSCQVFILTAQEKQLWAALLVTPKSSYTFVGSTRGSEIDLCLNALSAVFQSEYICESPSVFIPLLGVLAVLENRRKPPKNLELKFKSLLKQFDNAQFFPLFENQARPDLLTLEHLVAQTSPMPDGWQSVAAILG